MVTLIDASLLIAAERGKVDFGAWLDARGGDEFLLGAITASELWHGVHRADTAARRSARATWVRAVLDAFPVVPFDARAAEVHARVWADLERKGLSIGAHDLVLAATALSIDAAVATLDLRDFRRVAGLRVVGA